MMTDIAQKIKFIKNNIGISNDEVQTDLSFLFDQYSNIFLKMDIEGGEYPWLLSLDRGRALIHGCVQRIVLRRRHQNP
jgi:hypothetical protein